MLIPDQTSYGDASGGGSSNCGSGGLGKRGLDVLNLYIDTVLIK